jgi:hypothetical protein
MNYEKLPAIEGGTGGCACCGYQYQHLPLKSLIAVGFGGAYVTKNNEVVYDEQDSERNDKPLWRAQDAENEALKEPDNDWRIHLIAPLSERHYQRQDDGLWVLYKKGEGFA